MDLERAEGEGRARDDALREHEPELLGDVHHVVGRVDDRRLDGRDVQGELERLAHPKWATLEVVGVGWDVAAAEIRRDVHEHRRRGDRAVLEADDVVDRLERGTGLAPPVGEHVELGLEQFRLGRRVVGRGADVGQDLAGPVVDRDERAVVDVLAAKVLDPVRVPDALAA